MSKYLFIIESPNKRKKISSFLSKDYDIVATVGHVCDLPQKKLGVDIKKDFEPTYEISDGKSNIIKDIKAKAKKSDIVYLATDSDREGEGIARNVSRYLPKSVKIKRVKYGSITKNAILNGISEAGDIDSDMVDSYETRRILDRLVGYKCSYITKRATGGPSAGRTQSAGLRILADREKEIRSFVPEEFWPISAELLTERFEKIIADIKKPKPLDIKTGEEAKKICECIKAGPILVSKFEKQEVCSVAYPPFTTSSMYQSAASILNWKSDKTASVAQQLYSSGLCTYHRTDSTYIVPEFVSELRSYISNSYGDKYLPSTANYFAKKSNSQEAHEACRVTDISLKTAGSNTDESRLYNIIWKRTVASQMQQCKILRTTAEFSCSNYILAASGSKLLFDGWRKVWDYGGIDEKEIPGLRVGEKVKAIDVHTERKETQPPPRYNQRSFQKKLETEGIGRPSTYASIPKVLEQRGYILNKKQITVTELGLKVNDFLVESKFCFVDVNFTSGMEKKLDDIANKRAGKLTVLKSFWKRLKEDIENAKAISKRMSLTDFDCPLCAKNDVKSKLVLRYSRFGPFFSCQKYPECDQKASLNDNKEPVFEKTVQKKYSKIKCPKCENRLVVRKGKKGTFLGCEKYSKGCKGIYDMDGNPIEISKKSGKRYGKKQ